MQPLPHLYTARASSGPVGDVELDEGPGVRPILSDSPPEFGGPDNRWSPETLLIASAANCLLLTFRGIARARRLPYLSATCLVEGRLDRVNGVVAFTELHLKAHVEVDTAVSPDEVRNLVEKAERGCLITNSLKAVSTLEVEVATREALAIG